MIPIREIASILNPAPKGRRFLAIYRFFCDESFDSDPNAPDAVPAVYSGPHIPASYVVAGFFASEDTWNEIERRWIRENTRAGVTERYHAAHVNGFKGEFENWSKEQQLEYSMNLLAILKDQKMDLHATACGILVRDYEEVISAAGREKFGHPYIACFKTVIAMIAQEMEIRNFQPDDKFSVILDKNSHENEAIDIFNRMKDSNWPFARRLATCARGSWEDFTELQPADLIAYETYKALHPLHQKGSVKARKSLASLFDHNGFMSYYLDRPSLKTLKPQLENATCLPNGFILQFLPVPEGGYDRR